MLRFVLAALLLLSIPVRAEEPGVAFAAAIAPEQAFEVCFKPDAIAAANCAMEKCKKATGGSDECIITSACGPGWAGAMGVTTSEIHWSETVCGAPDKAAVITALKAFCKGQSRYATACYIGSVWDEHGKETTLEMTLDPKKIKWP